MTKHSRNREITAFSCCSLVMLQSLKLCHQLLGRFSFVLFVSRRLLKQTLQRSPSFKGFDESFYICCQRVYISFSFCQGMLPVP